MCAIGGGVEQLQLMGAAAETELASQSGMFSLLDARVAAHLRRLLERNKSYPNLRAFVGFSQTTVAYKREPRFHGKPRQTLRRLPRDGLNAFFSFSYLPLRIMSVTG